MAKRLIVVGILLLAGVMAAGASMGGGRSTHAQAVASPLSWRIVTSFTAPRIRNEYLPVKANGVFVVMAVRATNGTSHLATLDGNRIRLRIGATKYRLSTTGLDGLELSGHPLLADLTLDPRATATGWLAFDVPPAQASAPRMLCIGSCAAQPQV